MAFYSQIGQPGIGAGGSPSAFTSPGMDPMTLALLFRMQNQSMPGAGGAPPMPPQPGGGMGPMPGMGAGMPPGMPPGAAGAPTGGAGMGGIMQMLMSNPQVLQQLMAMLKGGGAGPAGGSPGPGMGGL